MPNSGDILKEKSLNNSQIIALCFFLVSATYTVTTVLERIEKQEKKIEYVNDRIDRKFKQLKEGE
jgi:hypothetical protein